MSAGGIELCFAATPVPISAWLAAAEGTLEHAGTLTMTIHLQQGELELERFTTFF
jgi:hypothetical protein